MAEFKNYFARAGTYMSLLNFVLLLATFKKTYNLNISAIFVGFLGIFFMTIIGLIDYKFVLMKQNTHAYYKTPTKIEFDRINNKLDKLNEMINK